MYPGPQRPRSEVATLESEDTKVDDLDGHAFSFSLGSSRSRFEILPGRHRLGVSTLVVTGGPEASDADFQRSQTRVICFDARAGHAYVTRPVRGVAPMTPELVDTTTGVVVSVPCERR